MYFNTPRNDQIANCQHIFFVDGDGVVDKKQIVHSHLNQFFNFFDHAFGTADTELGFANITEGASRRASSRRLDGEELSAFANNMLVGARGLGM
jgi:hypothetical protein